MKNLLLSAVLFLLSASLIAQSVDGNAKKLIDTFVKSNMETEVEPVDPAAVSKVFDGNFFKIMVGFIEPGTGASYCGSDNYVSINGTIVKMIEPIHMDIECPILMSLIKKDFLLKDENAARLFEAALNVLYPVDEDEVQNVKHLKKEAQWIFLRGKFFDEYTAFIATTGTDGKVTKIELVLSYSVNQ
jgi:hypothetical protein